MGRTNDMEYYEEMIQVIASHADFGKRNPVDIGIECGYSEEEVMEMIRACSEQEEDRGETKERDVYYFIIERDRQNYIVSVNIHTWEQEVIQEIEKIDENSVFQLKGAIWARLYGGKTLVWCNLDNGEGGKFLSDSDILKILIREQEIIALTEDEIIGFGFHGEKRRKVLEKTPGWGGGSSGYYGDSSIFVEGKDSFYLVSHWITNDIWAIDKEFKKEKRIKNRIQERKSGSTNIAAVECTEEGLCWHSSRGDKCIEKNPEMVMRSDLVTGEDFWMIDSCVYEIVRTKNYIFVVDKILSSDRKQEICGFKIERGFPVVGVFEKDIFIGVHHVPGFGSRLGDTECKKIDLQNERKPVRLPV